MKKIRLKDCFSNRGENLSDNFVGKILYVDIGSVSYEKGIINKDLMNFEEAPSRAKKIVKHDDIIISTVRTYLKSIVKIENPEHNLIVSTGFSVLTPKKNYHPKFLEYCLKNDYIHNIISQKSKGVSYPSINNDDLLAIEIDCPSYNRQIILANYLDIETKKLDKIITLLNRKIILLYEMKKALALKVIKKGLNLNVKMKKTDIEWIGNIPAHWKIKKVKEIAKWQTGFTPDTKNMAYYNGNDDWITIRDMDGKYIKESKNKINGSLFPKDWITPANSLLFSFKLSIGQVAFNERPVFTNEAICSFSSKSKIDLNYFYYAAPIFINRNSKKNIYDADLLNQDLIANAYCLVPPKLEQVEIANFLDKKNLEFDKKIDLVNKKIELLKEYKQSLIYAVITEKKEI